MFVICKGERFLQMVREAGDPAPTHELPPIVAPDKERLGQACERHNIRILGPLPE